MNTQSRMNPLQTNRLWAHIGGANLKALETMSNSLALNRIPMCRIVSVKGSYNLNLSKHSALRGKSSNKASWLIILKLSLLPRLKNKRDLNQVWVISSRTHRHKIRLRIRSAMCLWNLVRVKHQITRWIRPLTISRFLRVTLPWCKNLLSPLERGQR